MKALIVKATAKAEAFETSLGKDSISMDCAINLAKHPTEDCQVTKMVFEDDDPMYEKIKKSEDCLGTPEEFRAHKDYDRVTLVAVPLPSPREGTGIDGKKATLRGGVEFMTLAEAKASGKAWAFVVEHNIAGV